MSEADEHTDDAANDPGRGRDSASSFDIDKGRPRQSLNLLRRAIGAGWPVGQDTKDRAVPVLEKLAFDPATDDRTRLKAVDCLRMMSKDNVDAAVALDKIERLETGDSTENASVTVRFVNRINGND